MPSLLWLWFWLKEDSRRPEPRVNIMWAFLGGMAAVPIAIVFEYFVFYRAGLAAASALLAWAFIEEILKYFAARKTAISKPVFDEPVDAIIYMITVALGFAALENTLFIIKTFMESGVVSGLDIGNIRFIGATLLHTASSAIVGSAVAFSYPSKKALNVRIIIGLVLAGLLHFAFNYLIINIGDGNAMKVMVSLWIVIIAIILIFEKVKKNYAHPVK